MRKVRLREVFMYEYAFYGMSALLLIIGVILIAVPKICTKKEYQDIPEQVQNTRKMGFFYIAFGVFLLIIKFLIDM